MMKFILSMIIILFINSFWKLMILMFIYSFLYLLFIPLMWHVVLNNYLYIDTLSYNLIFLSIWIISLMFLSSENIYLNKNNYNLFQIFLLFLMISLMISFSVNNLMLFYMFFEISLIPTFLLILGWGYQPERINAGIYLLFYTLLASLPMLMGIFFLKNQIYSLSYSFFYTFNMNLFLYLSMMMAFLVKLPMFLVHSWLPKAHVEAPISGSMILAAVLLKLGGYGLIRLMMIMSKKNIFFSNWWISLSLFGGSLISLNCLRQIDLKSLIAFSSVAHMGLCLGGIMTINYWGFNGSLVIMIGHGLCSSGLFCLANMSYERTHSRSMMINKGMMSIMPSLTMWWFLLSSSNMAAPPSLNLVGEIDLINSLISYSWICMILIFLLSFFSAIYSLYLFSYSQHGVNNSLMFSFMDIKIREYMLLMFHWLPLNLMFLSMYMFIM